MSRPTPSRTLPVRFACVPVLAVVLAALVAAGCKPPAKLIALLSPRPTPTVPPRPAAQAKVELVQVQDDRVRGEGDTARATIEVVLPETKRSDVASARVVVTKVVDDLGTNLVPDKAGEARFKPVRGSEEEGPVGLTVPVKNASRKAKVLREVTAEVELYMPKLDPAALATVPRFLGESGKPLVHPALKGAGVEVSLQSPAQIEAEKKAFGEKSRAEARKAGLDAAMVDQAVSMALDTFFTPDQGDVVLKVSDPKEAIQEIVFVDPSGAATQVNSGRRAGFVVLSSQGESPGPDWGLQVRLKTPRSFQRYTFTLKDVALP